MAYSRSSSGTRTHAISVALPISSAATRATISMSSVISFTGYLPSCSWPLLIPAAARRSQQGRQGGIACSRHNAGPWRRLPAPD
jgi:hypothetical protein